MPSPQRWAQVEAAFAEAIALPEAERAGFLATLTRDDPGLAEEVQSLLGARDPWWLDQPVVALPRESAPEGPAEWIGPYRLVRSLGLGGMGEVWLAVREGADFRQSVALKIVRSGMESAELLAGFRAERQILGTLNHPNIAHLLDVGETPDGLPYLALEYVEGLPLTEYCDRQQLPLRRRLQLFRSVCDAVRYAHQNLVVHRDLKPSNILVTPEGVPKLLDFGIAKVLSPNTDSAGLPIATPDQVLTPDYAAPEQVEGGTITTASDLYSLGVILYELVAGQRPYRASGRSQAELAQLIRDYRAVPPSAVRAGKPGALARDLDAIVLRAMARDPAQRYSSAEQLGADLDRALDSRPVSARPPTAGYVARRFIRRHRLGVAAAALAALVLIGFLATVLRQAAAIRERSVLAEQQRQRAQQVATFLQQLFRGADPAETRGDTLTARQLLDRGAERVTRELQGQPTVQADLMEVISGIYQDLGLYDPAERLAGSALALRRARVSGDDSALAVSLVEHGKALHWQGKATEAEARYREALALWRRLGDSTGPLAALTLTYLGSALQDQERDSTAERIYREALAFERDWTVPADTILALTLNNLGVVLRHKGDLAGAEAAHREALALRRRALGENHPDALQSLNNVAVAVGSRGDLGAAEPLFIEVVTRWRRVLGDQHPRVADALVNLGGLYLRKKEPGRAVPLFTEALAIRRERFGPKHPAVAQALFNLGVALQAAGQSAEAGRRYREALAIRLELYGPDHPAVKAAREAIAGLSTRRGP